MNAAAWVRRRRDRPVSESERRAASTAITLLLITAALMLAMARTGVVPAPTPAREPHRAASSARPATPRAPSAGVLRTARRFLDGYLAFVYGHGPASAVKDATASFLAALRLRARTVPPALLALHPRVLALHASYLLGKAIVVTVLVKDGEVLEYPIRVLLARRGRRYLVTGLAGA